ncbi:MAG: hypothetical protein OXC95_17920 [Dehalococcoidia bacterium]|nr:hypothetical protein [Dehalococcoidia bacterium]
MKATLDIDDEVMRRLRKEAIRRRTTVSELVEDGLRHILDGCRKATPDKDSLPPIPTRLSGGILVDISNRDELYRIFDEDASFRY